MCALDQQHPGRSRRERKVHSKLDSLLSLFKELADRIPVFFQDFLRRIPEKALRCLVQFGEEPGCFLGLQGILEAAAEWRDGGVARQIAAAGWEGFPEGIGKQPCFSDRSPSAVQSRSSSCPDRGFRRTPSTWVSELFSLSSGLTPSSKPRTLPFPLLRQKGRIAEGPSRKRVSGIIPTRGKHGEPSSPRAAGGSVSAWSSPWKPCMLF